MKDKYVPVAAKRAIRTLGQQLSVQRRLLGLRVEDVAARSGASAQTVSRMEKGEPINSLTLVRILQALQMDKAVLDATNPYKTDLGIIRANRGVPQRVRRPF
jgi:transcriptional regulator with XRE-family HTH domain